ncbi:MAG: PP2C family serine/threonine-protein phosphatase [Thermoanaerobaculia bacterium]
MSPPDWRLAAASTLGTAHVKLGLPCQDAHRCSVQRTSGGEPVLIAVVCDGAGSAARADAGAELASQMIHDEIAAALGAEGFGVRGITPAWIEERLGRFQAEVAARAEAEEHTPRDFACTLLAAAVGPDCAAFFQIGDGAIVVGEEEETYRWIFWPDHGEYENVTFFATDPEAVSHLQFELLERRIDEVALLSDGLQRLALHYQTRTAHAAFFKPMLATLRAMPEDGLESLSARLEAWLSSPPVNERTDDDKTLVLASRRGFTAIMG